MQDPHTEGDAMPLPNTRATSVSLPPPIQSPDKHAGENPRVNVVFRADAFEVRGDEFFLLDDGVEVLRLPRRTVRESVLVGRDW